MPLPRGVNRGCVPVAAFAVDRPAASLATEGPAVALLSFPEAAEARPCRGFICGGQVGRRPRWRRVPAAVPPPLASAASPRDHVSPRRRAPPNLPQLLPAPATTRCRGPRVLLLCDGRGRLVPAVTWRPSSPAAVSPRPPTAVPGPHPRRGGPRLRPHGPRGCGVSAEAWRPYPRRRCPLPSGCCPAALSAAAPPRPSRGGKRGCGAAADQPAASFTTAAPPLPRPWRRPGVLVPAAEEVVVSLRLPRRLVHSVPVGRSRGQVRGGVPAAGRLACHPATSSAAAAWRQTRVVASPRSPRGLIRSGDVPADGPPQRAPRSLVNGGGSPAVTRRRPVIRVPTTDEGVASPHSSCGLLRGGGGPVAGPPPSVSRGLVRGDGPTTVAAASAVAPAGTRTQRRRRVRGRAMSSD